MNIRILALIVSAGLLAGCSTQAAKVSVTADGNSAAAGESAPNVHASDGQKVTRPGTDNSEIVSTADEFGNTIETRNFRDHEYIDNIVIKTLTDTSKVGTAFGKNGEKLPMSDPQIALALDATADELAEMVGLGAAITQTVVQSPMASNPYPMPAQPMPAQPMPPMFSQVETQPVEIATPDPKEIERQREAARKAAAEKLAQMQKEINQLPLSRRPE